MTDKEPQTHTYIRASKHGSCYNLCLNLNRTKCKMDTTNDKTESQVPNDKAKESKTEDNAGLNLTQHDLIYSINDSPPWYICIILGFQDFFIMFGSIIVLPIIISPMLCIDDIIHTGELIATGFVVSGINTFIQVFLGVRLPIIQGGTFTFFVPIVAILSLPQWTCEQLEVTTNTSVPLNNTDWRLRMCEIQGAVCVASLLQVLIGLSGLTGLLMRCIGPVSIAPTVSLIGLSLIDVSSQFAATNWWVALMTSFLIILFSQHMRNIEIPYWKREKGRCVTGRYPVFKVFPVLIAVILSWVCCAVLTVSDVIPDDKHHWAYASRTDAKSEILHKSKWFIFPYPGQWGIPTVSTAGVVGMFSGVLGGMVESIGDYYICASLSGAPPPPIHAINRGVLMEGIGCVFAGLWGTGTGTTSYSENIGAIGITKVGNRRGIYVAAAIMIIVGVIGKFSAFFATIPDPIVGGMLMTVFGMISGVGFFSLKNIDLSSSRNIFIVGFSIFFGLTMPRWLRTEDNIESIRTGVLALDQTLQVLLSTGVFVGGALAVILDNTVPGSLEERGMKLWRDTMKQSTSMDGDQTGFECYNLPFGMPYLRKCGCAKYLPISPTFKGFRCRRRNTVKSKVDEITKF